MTETIETAQEQVWQLVSAVPAGQVATYGQIAALAGMPSHARLVGRVLARLPAGSRLPWHRVINSQGRITNPNRAEQRKRLAAEGVTLVKGRVNLRQYQWVP